MADLFDEIVEKDLATMKQSGLYDQLKKLCPHGHPQFIDMVLRALILHSYKNKDYAGGGPPLGNFTRRATKAGAYKVGPELGQPVGIDLSDEVQLMLWDMEKQLDAAWWLRIKKNKAAVEGVSKRLLDVGVYSFITMCWLLDEELAASLAASKRGADST